MPRKNRTKSGPKSPQDHGPNRTSWKPGQSGNPKGRPPLPAEYKMAIESIGQKALAALDAIIDQPRHPRHEQATEYAINRWKGMPRAHQQISTPPGAPLAVSVTSKPAKPTSGELRAALEAKLRLEPPPGATATTTTEGAAAVVMTFPGGAPAEAIEAPEDDADDDDSGDADADAG